MAAALICLLITVGSMAQPKALLTGQPDTSFTNYSAYLSAKRLYPDIRLAEELRSPAIEEKRSIIYCTMKTAGNDRNLLLDVFYPTEISKKKRTAIIIIHGGGWRTGNRTQHYPLAQTLASLGYVCFTPEYRLSTEALYPAAILDLQAAIRWVHSNAAIYNIDGDKIVALGFSAGGELAAFLGATDSPLCDKGRCNAGSSSKVQAIVDIDGILSFVHPESGEGDDSKKTSSATYWFGYSKQDSIAIWENASALKYVGPYTPPTLFINSSVKRMHAGRNDYVEVLNKYGIYTEVHEFPDAPHAFCLFHPWFNPTVKYIDDFLKNIFIKQ